jgi:hypothetical protein
MTNSGTTTLAELLKLIADSKGEWEHIEFKKTTGELHGGMETLCGQGLRTTFPWVFWGFHGKYKKFI